MVGCEGRRTVRLRVWRGWGGSQGSVCLEHQIWDYFGWVLHLCAYSIYSNHPILVKKLNSENLQVDPINFVQDITK